MKTRGFTLIELLVVIAIIGILSAVVLASLNTARSKGKDAAIQSNLESIRSQAELRRSADKCYPGSGGTCSAAATTITALPCGAAFICSDATIARALGAAQATGPTLISFQQNAGALGYAVAVQLVTDPTKAWCVDGASQGKLETLVGGTGQAQLNAVITGNATCL